MNYATYFFWFMLGAVVVSWWHDKHRNPPKKGDRGFMEEAKSAVTPENKAEGVRNIAVAMLAASTLFSLILFVGSLLLVKQSRDIRLELQQCKYGVEVVAPLYGAEVDEDDEED